MKKNSNERSEKVFRKRVIQLIRNKVRKSKKDVSNDEKSEQAHFVMNSGGCLLNGEPFDPHNLPDGVVVVVDQKRTENETNIKQTKPQNNA